MAPPYRIIKAPGGTWHVHPDGKRTWHPAARMRPGPGRAVGFVAPRAPRAPSAPAVAGAAPGAVPVDDTAQFAPDASYFADLARQRFEREQAMARFTREGAEDLTGHTESMRRYNEQEPLAQQNANEGYNRQGLFYSGKLGQEKARLATQYARTRADMQAGYQARETARAEARRALEAGATVEEAAALAAAVDRGIERDSAAADANALVPNVPTAPAAPSVPAVRPTASPRRATPRPVLRKPTTGRKRPVVRDHYRAPIGSQPRVTRSPTRRRRRVR